VNRKSPLSAVIILVSTAIAIASGVLVLAGYFFAQNAEGQTSQLTNIRLEFLNWAIILAGFAIFIGILNLIQVHFKKTQQKQKGSFYSLLLILSLVATFLFVLIKPGQMEIVFTTIQLPVEASLMALLVVTLTYASIRLVRRRLNLLSVIFLVTALLILLGTAPLPFLGNIPGLSDWVRPFIAQVMAAAGARGILLGVALGTLTTGLRILFGADRHYGGNK
jgi:membrane-associated HD superfamily phosphohydrolase